MDTGYSEKVVMLCRRKRLIHHGLVEQGYASSRICKILRLSHAHVKALEGLSDEALIVQIRAWAFQHKRYGYRRIWVLLRRQDILIGLKRLKRLWQKERLQVKKRPKRPRRPGVVVLAPERVQSPNHVWTVDFVHDRLSRGGSLRLLSVVDEFTRQCLCLRVEPFLKSEQVRETLEVLFKDYGKPLYLRSNNGSEFIARSLQHWLKEHGTKPLFIEPGSPWQNCPQALLEELTNVDAL